MRRTPALLSLVLLTAAPLAEAAVSSCSVDSGKPYTVYKEAHAGAVSGSTCGGFYCQQPPSPSPFLRLPNPACDAMVTSCQVELVIPWTFPGNQNNTFDFAKPLVYWFESGTPPGCHPTTSSACGDTAVCGRTGLDGTIGTAQVDTVLVVQAQCSTLGQPEHRLYSARAYRCAGSSCQSFRSAADLDLRAPALSAFLGCVFPRKDDCEQCEACLAGGAAPAGGGPPIAGGEGTGPGAMLRHAARGVGGPGLPGTPAWNQTLGRYWSHDYAERIVVDPDESHVWLLTKTAVFREFSDLAGGVYTTVSPSDEYRTLTYTGSGWELLELDGTVHRFGADGLWLETEDRNGNAKVATYTAGVLSSVAFPDGRHEDFGYHPSGKLATIAEVGVDGTTTRTWSYTWSGDDLVRIDRPDGTALLFTYGEPVDHPGFLTRIDLEGTGSGLRVERAWEYDAQDNVLHTWRGDASRTGANAVDVWSLSFDEPALPTETTVTDPLGQSSLYTMDRDPVSEKPQILSISGDCPGCGLSSNTEFVYGDASHPLRPTRQIDGNGNLTDFTYSAAGQVLTRTEAAATALERTTTWTYDANYPVLVATVERESVAGSPNLRRETWLRDAAGNPTTRRIEGLEAGTAFSLDTVTTFNAAGQPTSTDPPGHGTADTMSFTYDPARGDLVMDSRTDPLIGTTTYGHDAFHRLTSIEDVNGVITTTEFDAVDRVTRITEQGATPAGDRVTEHVYDGFGDLEKTVLPAGNEIAYGYDAAGRLISVERRASAASPGERTLWTLDGAGNRTREELQRWDGSAWITESWTDFVYTSRCHLARIDHADGTSTEHAYDCNGNLSQVWDAAHPSAGQTAPATQSYSYDELDRLVEVRQPWGGAGGGAVVTSYDYDVQDHLVSVTDGEANTTTYTYSDRDLLTEEVSPASGTTTHAYDEHGELVETVDARGVVAARTVDALDRVTLVDYPGTDLDVAYAYDAAPTSCASSFPMGRLASITRNGASIDYCHDRFGQVTQDGALGYAYDLNGNRTEITYPGGVTATYAHDFADRQASLSVTTSAGTTHVVTAATWLPSGPLTSHVRGNGTSERRTYTNRYFPATIELQAPQPLAWTYDTDAVGNILRIERCTGDLELTNGTIAGNEQHTSCAGILAGPSLNVASTGALTLTAGQRIVLRSGFSVATGGRFTADVDPALAAAEVRDFAYQGVQYYLTRGDGPWGERDWTYDKIGNRLSETRGRSGTSEQDSYLYEPNATSANSPILDEILLGVGGVRDYTWGPAGHLTQVASGSNQVDLTTDAAGRMSRAARSDGTTLFAEATFSYDGRSYLTATADPAAGSSVLPTYNSEGRLTGLADHTGATLDRRHLILYFAGAPVAQWTDTAGTESWQYLTTDHLGTPLVTSDATGAEIWRSTLDAWAGDSAAGVVTGAVANEVFLRLPGQWESQLWAEAVLGTGGMYYNVHRWYAHRTGSYWRPDPLGLQAGWNLYRYADGNPLLYSDESGLSIYVCSRAAWGLFGVANHSYLWDDRDGLPPDQRYCGVWSDAVESGPGTDACNYVPGSEGLEDRVMECCRFEKKHQGVFYVPFLNDCQTGTEQALRCAGLSSNDPGIPGGRLGLPCDECSIVPPPPDPPGFPGLFGSGAR